MCACVWSCSNADVLAFPARFLFRFFVNHSLLQMFDRPQWLTVRGRTADGYVKRVLAAMPNVAVKRGAEVTAVAPSAKPGGKVRVTYREGASAEPITAEFDHVVLACHSDEALTLLRAGGPLPAPLEPVAAALADLKYTTSTVLVHRDARLMPSSRAAWSAWNFLRHASAGEDAPVCLTYWINTLQNLGDTGRPVLVTLNPPPGREPDPAAVVHRMTMAHPVPSLAGERAKQALQGLQGRGGVWVAGAYLGYGFHEDGFRAGETAALGILGDRTTSLLPVTLFPAPSAAQLAARLATTSFLRSFVQRGALEMRELGGHSWRFGEEVDACTKAGAPSGVLLVHRPEFYTLMVRARARASCSAPCPAADHARRASRSHARTWASARPWWTG
jgi:cyclopropane-fatty-acyl-phospholipid synthase